MPVSLKSRPTKPKSSELELAFKIVEYTHDTAKSLLDGFVALRKGKTQGTTTDEEQDLLRALLLFSCAGLDSSVKQIIQDAMPRLALHNESVRDQLQKFGARRLRRGEEPDNASPTFDAVFLAQILVGNTHENLIGAFRDELTGKSLQSVEQMNRVVAGLGVAGDSGVKKALDGGLGETFSIRNKIAHEMDINFSTKNRNRNSRKRDDMVRRTNEILNAADAVLAAVDALLAKCPVATP